MAMVNERDREKKSESSICWARDTEIIIKSNEIKKPRREAWGKSFGIVIQKGA